MANAELDLNYIREEKRQNVINSIPVRQEQTKQKQNLDNKKLDKTKESITPKIQERSLSAEKIEVKDIKQKKIPYVPGEVLVKFKKETINLEKSTGRTKATQFSANKNLDKKGEIRKSNIAVLKSKGEESTEDMISRLKNDPSVEYIEPNYKRYPNTINTDDTYGNLLWGLDNTDDKDINAPEAWDISEGDENEVIVAVIDSGVAYNHPDLINNMWDGSQCLDDSGVALNDCSHGYDYESDDKFPLDNDGHGTHIAGTIGAVKDNNMGIIGVAPNAKIMAIKFGSDIASEIRAIDFAIQNGAKIINASFSGSSFSTPEYEAIERFKASGGIFIAAAGNDGINNDNGVYSYPSDYDLDNIISVAATDQYDILADFSNYGITSVDVGAPGVSIYSTEGRRIFEEDFESVIVPDIGTKFTQYGDDTWGTLSGGSSAIYGDYANWGNYQNDISSGVDSSIIDLSEKPNSYLQFEYFCDTEEGYDALGLFLYNGSDWNLVDTFTGYNYGEKTYLLTDYAISNFQLEFFWMTDVSNIGGPYLGCYVDNIKIINADSTDGSYQYMQGTSMAAPHVAGLAGLIWGYKSDLTYVEVKDTILTTGDGLISLAGKTTTGKRINAFNALQSLSSNDLTISGTVLYYDGVKPIPDANVILEDDQGIELSATSTDANGYYEFNELTSGDNYVIRIEKDGDTLGLTGADQGKIGRHIVQLELFDSIYKIISGDVNNSGGLTGADQGKIGRFIVGLDDNLFSGAWKFYSSDAVLTEENYLTEGLTKIYTNLTTDTTGQNFIGIKMGDVNNTWE